MLNQQTNTSPDVRTCSEIARQARSFYPLKDWPEIEPIVRRLWEFQDRGIAWAEAKPVVAEEWLKRAID
jgi:hypothetical protein